MSEILGHSDGGKAAGVAIHRHPQIPAGVNLDGMIAAELITAGLDRPFGLMLGLDTNPGELRDIETFLSNMRAPHRVRTLDIHHYGFSDFVVFNPQAQRADPTLGSALEAIFFTGTLDSLRAGRRALTQQRRFLVRFFDRYLETKRGSGAGAGRTRPRRWRSTVRGGRRVLPQSRAQRKPEGGEHLRGSCKWLKRNCGVRSPRPHQCVRAMRDQAVWPGRAPELATGRVGPGAWR